MAEPPKFLQSVYDNYPDDQSKKEIFIQAAGLTFDGVGDRHVVIWWTNGQLNGSPVTQLIQLTGQAGCYSYYCPVAIVCTDISLVQNLQISLGEFTREQRDKIIALSKKIIYDKKSTVNGCRVWTRDLLEVMVNMGLLSQEFFRKVDADIPLVLRKAEA